MAITRHRLDVVLLPVDPEDRAWAPAAAARLQRAGRWPDGVISGGTAQVESSPNVRFFANRQGGFYVRCPTNGESIVPRFTRALEAWRAGGPQTLDCVCGAVHPLPALAFSPPAGFAAACIRVVDAEAPDVPPEVATLLGAHLRIWQRG